MRRRGLGSGLTGPVDGGLSGTALPGSFRAYDDRARGANRIHLAARADAPASHATLT